jgi:hypothetical protein
MLLVALGVAAAFSRALPMQPTRSSTKSTEDVWRAGGFVRPSHRDRISLLQRAEYPNPVAGMLAAPCLSAI